MFATADFDAQMASWINGVDDEVKFWDKWLVSQDPQYADARRERLSDFFPVSFPQIIPYLQTGSRVLDCGSSLASTIGNVLPGGGRIELVPADPLAPIYDALLEKNGLSAYVRTKFAMVEFLDDIFEPASFDMACMCNSLDHSYDPVIGIKQLLNMVEKDGYVFLCHHRNEAENGKYHGLHQWNMDFEGDSFFIWNKTRKYDINRTLYGIADVSVDYGSYQGIPGETKYLSVMLRKKTTALFDLRSEKTCMLSFFIRAFAYTTSQTYRHIKQSPALDAIIPAQNDPIKRWQRLLKSLFSKK